MKQHTANTARCISSAVPTLQQTKGYNAGCRVKNPSLSLKKYTNPYLTARGLFI